MDDKLNIWGSGQLLAFSGIDGASDYYYGLTARTSVNGAALSIEIPGSGLICFDELPPEKTFLTSDCFALTLSDGSKVQGALADCYHLLIKGKCQIKEISGELEFLQKDGKTLIASKKFFDSSKIDLNVQEITEQQKRWLSGIEIPTGLFEVERSTLCKALSQMKSQVYSPEGRIKHRWTTPDRWPHRGMWLWDSAFHAIGFRHVDVEVARDAISAVFDAQREGGFVLNIFLAFKMI